MNMHPKSPAPIDDELKDFDFSGKSIISGEVVDSGRPATSAPSEIEIGDQRSPDENPAEAEEHGKDKDWDDYQLEILDCDDLGPDLRHLSPAERNVLAEIDLILGVTAQDSDLPADDAQPVQEPETTKLAATDADLLESAPAFLPTAAQPTISGLPEGFSLHADGVYVVVSSDGADEDLDEQFLCSPLRVIDLFRQRDGSVWGRRIVVTNPEGLETTVAVLNEVLEARGRSFLSQLAGLGLRMGKVKRARETVLELLTSWNPSKLMLSTNRQGWADDACEAFVLGGQAALSETLTSFRSAATFP